MAKEKRLIDANALKRKLGAVTLYVQGLCFGKTILGKILESYRSAVFEEIDNSHTVDAVEVVRCKDCVYNENGCCTHSEVYDDTRYRPDFFCADGERRNDV